MSQAPRLLVRAILPSELEPARLLLASNGWAERVGDLAHFTSLVARSQIALVAVEGESEAESKGHVIGFLRAVTDGMSNGYISMVVVADGHRARGVGSALVQACVGANGDITWVLRAGREGVSAFYEKLGFRVSQVAMERPRRKAGGGATA